MLDENKTDIYFPVELLLKETRNVLCARAIVRALDDAKKKLCTERMRNAIHWNHLKFKLK